MLIAGDNSFQKYLEIQHYDMELEHLETKYGYPDGRLYLAYYDEKVAGCIGLRKIDKQHCEMKRLIYGRYLEAKRLESNSYNKL